MTPEESIHLIKSNLAEVLNPEIIDHVILQEQRPLHVYWGTATTGRPHAGYFVPMVKVAELLRAGCRVTILLADLHAYLDNMKAPLELIQLRVLYYERLIRSLLRAIGVDVGCEYLKLPLTALPFGAQDAFKPAPASTLETVPAPASVLPAAAATQPEGSTNPTTKSRHPDPTQTSIDKTAASLVAAANASIAAAAAATPPVPALPSHTSPGLHFVTGSSYQLSPAYTMDRLRLEGITRLAAAQRAGAEVVKQSEDPPLGGLTYPLMQALDEQHLGVDCQFGGLDQRKIFIFALEKLPRIGYRARAHLMNAMVPGLGEVAKMSSSEPDSKIDLLDAAHVVQRKLRKAVCAPGIVEGNGVLAFVEHVILRVLALKAADGQPQFVVERRGGGNGGEAPLVYNDMMRLKEDYAKDIVTPQCLKQALAKALNELLEPVRAEYAASPDWQDIAAKAYPDAAKAKKDFKKEAKNKGDPAKKAAALAALAVKAEKVHLT